MNYLGEPFKSYFCTLFIHVHQKINAKCEINRLPSRTCDRWYRFTKYNGTSIKFAWFGIENNIENKS